MDVAHSICACAPSLRPWTLHGRTATYTCHHPVVVCMVLDLIHLPGSCPRLSGILHDRTAALAPPPPRTAGANSDSDTGAREPVPGPGALPPWLSRASHLRIADDAHAPWRQPGDGTSGV
jgi:hypothetical protein